MESMESTEWLGCERYHDQDDDRARYINCCIESPLSEGSMAFRVLSGSCCPRDGIYKLCGAAELLHRQYAPQRVGFGPQRIEARVDVP